jgi:hypothetical protein
MLNKWQKLIVEAEQTMQEGIHIMYITYNNYNQNTVIK